MHETRSTPGLSPCAPSSSSLSLPSSIYLSIYLSFYKYIDLSIYLSIYLSFSLPGTWVLISAAAGYDTCLPAVSTSPPPPSLSLSLPLSLSRARALSLSLSLSPSFAPSLALSLSRSLSLALYLLALSHTHKHAHVTRDMGLEKRGGRIHPRLFVGVSQKSIFNRPCQFLATNAHKMAPRTSKGLQERAWDAPT